MAEQTQVETGQEAQTTAPSAPPATPTASPDFEKQVSERLESERRKLQAAKDREIAGLHRQYQERERLVREAAKGRLKQHGDEQAEEWDQQIDLLSEAQENRARKAQEQAEQANYATAAEIAAVFGLDVRDPRLYEGGQAQSWDEFRARARNAAAADARAEREREKQAEAQAATEAANARVQSGNLSTLGGAGVTPGAQAQKDELYAQLLRMLGTNTPRAEREAVKAKLRALGEKI